MGRSHEGVPRISPQFRSKFSWCTRRPRPFLPWHTACQCFLCGPDRAKTKATDTETAARPTAVLPVLGTRTSSHQEMANKATNVPQLIAAWPHPSAFEAPAGTSVLTNQQAAAPSPISTGMCCLVRVSWPGKLNDHTESVGCSVRHIQLLQARSLALSVNRCQLRQSTPCICSMICMYVKTVNHARLFAASFETADGRDAVKSEAGR